MGKKRKKGLGVMFHVTLRGLVRALKGEHIFGTQIQQEKVFKDMVGLAENWATEQKNAGRAITGEQ
eukprot:2391978-Karenia_brevis.AAC.1